MLLGICRVRVALLFVPLVCGAAYASMASGNSVEGYHVVGTLAHGLAYTNASDVSAQNNGEWISPSVSSTMGITYNKTGVQWGAYSYDLQGAFQLGYAESNVEFDSSFAVRPDYSFSIASADLGTLAFSSMIKSTLGDGYVKGKLYSDNRWTEYTWTGGVGPDIYPSMLQFNHHQETGLKGGSYTTPSLFVLKKGGGGKLFMSARDKVRTSYGASFEVAGDNGMALMLLAAYSPHVDVEAAIDKISNANFNATANDYDQAVRYYQDPWTFPITQAKEQDYLISLKMPDNVGLAVTGFWARKVPKAIEIWTFNDAPHVYGVNASYQRDFGYGATTLRLGYQQDSVRGLSYLGVPVGSKLNNMTQDRWSVALTQPIMKGLNALVGYNRYSVKGYPFALLSASVLLGMNRPGATDMINSNALFFVGMEYLINI